MKFVQTGWAVILIVAIVAGMNQFLMHGVEQIVMTLVLLVVLSQVYKLTIRIDDYSLKFSMGVGLIGSEYLFQDIESVRPVNYFSLGWGIRWKPGQLIFNVSGNRAIELTLKGKSRKILVGCTNPEAVCAALNQAMSRP